MLPLPCEGGSSFAATLTAVGSLKIIREMRLSSSGPPQWGLRSLSCWTTACVTYVALAIALSWRLASKCDSGNSAAWTCRCTKSKLGGLTKLSSRDSRNVCAMCSLNAEGSELARGVYAW